MKETEIHDFAEFHEVIERYDEPTVIDRGMKSVPYLQPSDYGFHGAESE